MSYELKVSAYTVKPTNEPIFSEQATHISVEDEAAGPFVVIRQDNRTDNSIAIDFAEWDMLTEAVKKLQKEWEEPCQKD